MDTSRAQDTGAPGSVDDGRGRIAFFSENDAVKTRTMRTIAAAARITVTVPFPHLCPLPAHLQILYLYSRAGFTTVPLA